MSSVPETLQVKAEIVGTRFRGPIIELQLDIGEEKTIAAHVPKGLCLASGFERGRVVYVGITAFHAFSV